VPVQDFQTDANNCGACGNRCGATQRCSQGNCIDVVCDGFELCDCGVEIIALGGGAAPSINENATVAYSDGVVVYLAKNGQVTTIDPPVEPLRKLRKVSGTTINAHDQVVFQCELRNWDSADQSIRTDLYRADSGMLTTIERVENWIDAYRDLGIDGAGRVAFIDATGQFTPTLWSDNAPTPIPVSLTPTMSVIGLTMNEAGAVALTLNDSRDGAPFYSVILMSDPQVSHPPAALSEGLNVVGSPSLSNDGSVAFIASFEDAAVSHRGLFVATAGGLTQRADLDPFPFSGEVAIDDAGQVAAVLGDGGTVRLVVFLRDGTPRLVAQRGNVVERATVTDLHLSSTGFRGRGQLAFQADLDDGRKAVVRVCVDTP
jgi:hypothetical protein